ncbi:hypothetical protein [Streptomyces sp. NPDC054975]
MPTPRFLGYHRRQDGAVHITYGCRTLDVVRDEGQVSALLAALAAGNPQKVLAHWAAAGLRHRGGAAS